MYSGVHCESTQCCITVTVRLHHVTVDDTNRPGRTVLLRSSETSMAGISMYGAVLARSKYPTWFVLSTTPFHMLATLRWSISGALLQHAPTPTENYNDKTTVFI